MHSFISIFKKTNDIRRAKVLLVFFCFFVLLLVTGQQVSIHKPEWVRQGPKLPTKYRNLDLFSIFIANNQMNINNAIYYAIGPMISRARQADVLFVGNSRPFFAFRDDAIEGVEKQCGLKFFSLAGPGDNFPFCRDVIVRNHLFPSFIVLNDNGFFNPKLWPFQKEAMSGSWWHSWSNTYVDFYKWAAKYHIKKFIPEFKLFKVAHGKEIYTMYSPINGFLFMENVSGERYPFAEDRKKSIMNPFYLKMARNFINDMKRRGCKVILTFVPFGGNPDFILQEAEELGVPYVLPKLNNLETFDRQHLTPESSDQFAKAFFEIFFKLPEVQRVIQEKRVKKIR